MKINLTKKQYELLARIVYLGNWMANSHRTGIKGDECIDKYNQISDYIFSLSPHFGFSENYEHELEQEEMFEENSELNNLMEEYDDNVLWEKLADVLGKRDFFKKYSKEERENMDREEHFYKLMEFVVKYEDEFVEHGLKRMEIIRK